ncbi:MAG: LOG family protein [Cyanosarcina radialis HA8281-LM2]|jgi:hypothetical protein|nr:LOG family protein [Cyanosarcina radialis HA8281-LM2]
MASSFPAHNLESLPDELAELVAQLPRLKYGKLIQQALATIVRLAGEEIDRLDWKILSAALQDLEQGFTTFYPYKHVRKITIFGSARIASDTPEYRLAMEFARHVVDRGFMVMTGAGGGIMEAGNQGAGTEKSFGLNINLPYEQGANSFIAGNDKLLDFKYFFTRKLFMLRESDAIALFPGGFGTQDEAMECLTLCQTGRYGPVPMILIDRPGGSYWQDWDAYIRKHLLEPGLISPDDTSLYTITDNLEVAYETINRFYKVYHSSRYVKEKFVIRLNSELSDSNVEKLNADFSDILTKGKIEKAQAFPEEIGDETEQLPRLVLHFNQRDFGRLYQAIGAINQMGTPPPAVAAHPEIK